MAREMGGAEVPRASSVMSAMVGFQIFSSFTTTTPESPSLKAAHASMKESKQAGEWLKAQCIAALAGLRLATTVPKHKQERTCFEGRNEAALASARLELLWAHIPAYLQVTVLVCLTMLSMALMYCWAMRPRPRKQ